MLGHGPAPGGHPMVLPVRHSREVRGLGSILRTILSRCGHDFLTIAIRILHLVAVPGLSLSGAFGAKLVPHDFFTISWALIRDFRHVFGSRDVEFGAADFVGFATNTVL